MAKSQKINRRKPVKQTRIVDERPFIEPELPPEAAINPEFANAPVRTINFVEVGDMVGKQLQLILQQLNVSHDTARGGIHYFLPIRHGKIGPDIVFEEEWLDIVKQTCEVNESGEIVLQGNAKEVHVIRRKI